MSMLYKRCNVFLLSIYCVISFGVTVGEVYDITTVHRLDIEQDEFDYDNGRLEYSFDRHYGTSGPGPSELKGWEQVDIGNIKFKYPLSDKNHEVKQKEISLVCPVPSKEFVISFRSSSDEIYIFLLAEKDVITSEMIMIRISSRSSTVSICQDYREQKRVVLPNGRSRKCFTTAFYFNHDNEEYQGSNEYSSLFIKLEPNLKIFKSGDYSNFNLLTEDFYNAYKNEEIDIKYIAVSVKSGSANFRLWPSTKVMHLSQSHGYGKWDVQLPLSFSPRNRNRILCIFLKFYIEPNSNAAIKIILEDSNGHINVGTLSSEHGEIQKFSMTSIRLVFVVENEYPQYTFKITGVRESCLDSVLIESISIDKCDTSEISNFTTYYNLSGSTEIHAMSNARGLPVLLSNGSTDNSFIGVGMDECTTMKEGCSWTVSKWNTTSSNSAPPLQLSGNGNVKEITKNNISNHHVFEDSYLTFTRENFNTYREKFVIFLMDRTPNIRLSDMYHIMFYEYNLRFSLKKCTSINEDGRETLIPGDSTRICSPIVASEDIYDSWDYTKIKYSSGRLQLMTVYNSKETTLLDWTDSDPINVLFYRFGSWNARTEFHVNRVSSDVWSLSNEEGSFISPPFVPNSHTLCVSLTYYLPFSFDTSLELEAHWTGGEIQNFPSIERSEEWKTDRFIINLPPDKHNKQVSIELKGKSTDESEILIQRIAGCNGEGSEDILILSSNSSIYFPNYGYDVAVARTKKENSVSGECMNGGIFDEEREGCVCPAGFSGPSCEKGCGANRFGALCNGICSKTRNRCHKMIFCLPKLGCECATGLQGILCNKECNNWSYGAGCKSRCGKCIDTEYVYTAGSYDRKHICDSYTGECLSGCESGYYPPLCQQTYKYLLEEPEVSILDFNSIQVKGNLKLNRGRGKPRFYQIQYKEIGNEHDRDQDSWTETKPHYIGIESMVSTNITGLKPGTTYQIRIVLLDHDGESYQGSEVPYAEVTTHCIVPEEVDYELQSSEITEEGFTVSWQINHKNPEWCSVSQFELQYYANQLWLKLYKGTARTYRVTNMLPGEKYQIRVAALSNKSPYPFSPVLPVTTKYGAPEEVQDIQTRSTASHDLEVTWSPPPGSVLRYKVQYKCLKLLACKEEECSQSTDQVEVAGTSVILHNLLSFAQYSINISALGSSWGPSRHVLSVTDMTAPGAFPHQSATPIIQRTNTSFTVQWEQPQNCTYLNGYLYEYHYKLISRNNSNHIIEGNTQETTATFTDLTPHTQYVVKVYVVTSGGWSSDHPLEISVKTRATTPDPVEKLTVYKKSRRMIGVRWAEPKRTYGTLKSFTISYQAKGSNKIISSDIKITSCIAWPHLFCHRLNGLMPDTEYTISVSAQNSEVDEIGEPATIKTNTKETAPAAPSFLHVLSQSQTNLTIEWGLPDMINGMLRSFLINVEETDSFNSSECCQYLPVKEIEVQSEKTSYQLQFTDLQPASTYTVSVSAKTVAMGPAATITAYTSPPIPDMDGLIAVPDNPTFSDGSLTILIHPATEYESLIRGYLLFVLPQDSESALPKTSITHSWLSQEISKNINDTSYFAAEFDQEELETNPEVTVGSGYGLKVGKWGEMQNPMLENEKDYRLSLIILLEYCGVHSIGYAETEVFHVDY